MSRTIINRLRLADQIARLDRVDAQLAKVAKDLRPQLQGAKLAEICDNCGKPGASPCIVVGIESSICPDCKDRT